MTDHSQASIRPLTSWRGVFAVAILLCHCGEKAFTEMSCCGVVAYFMMSGFLMRMHHRPDAVRGTSFKPFFLMRALRLYPLHWLALALLMAEVWAFSMPITRVGTDALLPNLLLIQSYVPDEEVFFSFNTPSWFLCDLLLCYFCYPLIAIWLGKMSVKGQVCLFAALMLVYAVAMSHITDHRAVVYSHVFPPLRLYEFAMGVTLYNVYAAVAPRLTTRLNFMKASLAEGAILVLLMGLVAFSQSWSSPLKNNYNDSLMWEIPMALLILVAAFNAGREGLIGRLLCWKPLLWVGSMSLEVFMLHFVAGPIFTYLVSPLFGHFGIMVYDFFAVGQLPILLVLSWVVHRCFTRPVFAWAAKMTNNA